MTGCLTCPSVRAIVGDRAYRGLVKLAERKHVTLDIKAPPTGTTGFTPLWTLYKVEHTIAQLGRWRRSRCYEGTTASARAWLERRRTEALVVGDMTLSRQMHADEYELISGGGGPVSKEEYLGGIESGNLRYVVFEPASEMRVRLYDGAARRQILTCGSSRRR